MNRTGLAIALTVAVAVGLLFAFDPRFDLDISGWFFDRRTHDFVVNAQPWAQHSRNAARLVITLLAAPAGAAIVFKMFMPRRRFAMSGRAALFMLITLAIGPGVLANLILKDHWGRARPIDVVEFGGTDRFTPWWDPRGACPTNCSFIAGEPSGAFWTFAPAALAPPQWRALAYAGTLAFGTAIGVMRIGGGGHFFTDVVFAGVFMFLLVWTAHGLIYRWRRTRLAEGVVERFLARIGQAFYGRGGATKKDEGHAAFTPSALPEQMSSLPRAGEGDS
jgi:lipid A 4'-phosphatase